MSSLKKPINYKMLESELDDALKADELYKLQNDAKIRAIEQRVPTYDHFRGMVQAAHLRPLERSEMQKKAEVSWNHCHNNKNEDSLKTSDELNSNESNSNDPNANDTCDDTNINANKEPQTTAEFLKTYKSFPKYEQKFEYLLRFRTSLKDKYFQIEVPPDFLGDFINVGLDICKEDNVSDIINVLQILKQCNRFSLSITMISPKEKYYLELLFTKILSLGHISSEDLNMEELKSLMVDYDVSFSK